MHISSQKPQVNLNHTRTKLENKLKGNAAPHVSPPTTITNSIGAQPPGKVSTQKRLLTSPWKNGSTKTISEGVK